MQMQMILNKKGVSSYEIIALLLLLAAAWAGDTIGSRFGNTAGIVGMIAFPLILIILIEKLAWLERELILGQKPYPKCICGRAAIDSLPEDPGTPAAGSGIFRCSCGRVYDTGGRGIIEIVDNENRRPFARWKAFKGWILSD